MQELAIKGRSGAPLLFQFTEDEAGITLVRYLSTDISEVDIPAAVYGKPVTAIGASCFFGHAEIQHVTFPETLLVIGDNAFACCTQLQELLLPDGITTIGVYAFRDCRSLAKVILPAQLRRLSAGSFSYCHLRNVEFMLPAGLEVIEKHAFYSGGHFELIIPDSVTEIGVGAFSWGPTVKTSLPYDKGWYLDWPYGEVILDSAGTLGTVSDIAAIGDGCMLLEVDFAGKKETYFYPQGKDGAFSFESKKNQELMERELAELPNAQGVYEAWQSGLI